MGQRWIDTNVIMNAQNIDAGSTSYTSSIYSYNLIGTYGAMHIATGAATGSVTITQQCSIDGLNWLNPTNATEVAVGALYAAVTTATARYVQFTPVLAPYIRLGVKPIVAATITLSIITQGERL